MNPRLFGMVSTAGSREYTKLALKSFFENTTLLDTDVFYLIDNDHSLGEVAQDYSQVSVISNESPRSFASNMNHCMVLASEERRDLFFLNNDLVFSPNWLSSLQLDQPAIVCSVSNIQFQYSTPRISFERSLSIEQYLGRELDFLQVVALHRQQQQGYLNVLSLPFFAVKIPFEVYTALGPLDESFGRGGGEDGDYCLRAALARIPTLYALDSYLLHFNGKSTWAVETKAEEATRSEKFRKRFIEKWGKDLTALIVGYDSSVLEKYSHLREEIKSANFKRLVEEMKTSG